MSLAEGFASTFPEAVFSPGAEEVNVSILTKVKLVRDFRALLVKELKIYVFKKRSRVIPGQKGFVVSAVRLVPRRGVTVRSSLNCTSSPPQLPGTVTCDQTKKT